MTVIVLMSAYGPKRTSLVALRMSAFGGKADVTFCENSLSRSLLGVKRTCRFALHMSACDPKRTSACTGCGRAGRFRRFLCGRLGYGGYHDFACATDYVNFAVGHYVDCSVHLRAWCGQRVGH